MASALSEPSTLFFTIVKLAFFLINILENTFLITTGNDQSIQLMAKSFNRRLRLSTEDQRILPKHLTEVQNIQSKAKSFNKYEVYIQPKAKAYKQRPTLSNKGRSIQLKDRAFDRRLTHLTKAEAFDKRQKFLNKV